MIRTLKTKEIRISLEPFLILIERIRLELKHFFSLCKKKSTSICIASKKNPGLGNLPSLFYFKNDDFNPEDYEVDISIDTWKGDGKINHGDDEENEEDDNDNDDNNDHDNDDDNGNGNNNNDHPYPEPDPFLPLQPFPWPFPPPVTPPIPPPFPGEGGGG